MTQMTRAEAIDELTKLKLKYDEFRSKVVEAAMDAKESNGWCDSGFAKAMEDLGLKDSLPKVRKRVTLVVDLELDHESGYDLRNMEDEEWADAALESIRDNYTSSYELESYDVEEAQN